MGLLFDDYMGWIYGMIMGLLWDDYMGWLYGMIRDYYGMIIWDEYMGWFYGIIFGMIIWDDYIGWLWGYYGMIMGLYTHPLPLEISGGVPQHISWNYFSSNPPFQFWKAFKLSYFSIFFGHNGVRSSMHAYIHTSIHACIHTCIHTCMHTYIHTYINHY